MSEHGFDDRIPCACGCGALTSNDSTYLDEATGDEYASYECWLDRQIGRAEQMRDAGRQ